MDDADSVPADHLLAVGRIGRAHGVKGALIVRLDSDRHERLAAGARLHDGQRWLTVESARRQPDRRWLVHFVEVGDRSIAETMHGRTLSAEPIDDPDALWVHRLIGAQVVDQHGVTRGVCTAVVDNPANDLLELDTGHLVPVTFVVEQVDDVIRVDVPDGLFDLLD